MTDKPMLLVERLREMAVEGAVINGFVLEEAAREIERLEEKLRWRNLDDLERVSKVVRLEGVIADLNKILDNG